MVPHFFLLGTLWCRTTSTHCTHFYIRFSLESRIYITNLHIWNMCISAAGGDFTLHKQRQTNHVNVMSRIQPHTLPLPIIIIWGLGEQCEQLVAPILASFPVRCPATKLSGLLTVENIYLRRNKTGFFLNYLSPTVDWYYINMYLEILRTNSFVFTIWLYVVFTHIRFLLNL